MPDESTAPALKKSHCNNCKGDRNHIVLAKEKTHWEEDIGEGNFIDGSDAYEFLKCCGCDSVHLRHTSWFSEDTDDEGRPVSHVSLYPPKVERHEPRWFRENVWALMFQHPVKSLLEEIYRAVAAGSLSLATMGIRALLETMMIEKTGDKGSFKENLRTLFAEGHVSKRQLELLDEVIEAGHATIHRGFHPSEKDVHALLDIAENIVEAMYISPAHAESIRGKVPRRTPRAPDEERGNLPPKA